MKTVGQILRETREQKLISLEVVEKQIKIRKEFLAALEDDDYGKLPPPTFIQGFIKNYSRFLGLDERKMLAIFRRDFEARKHPPVVLESLRNPIKYPWLRLTPSKVLSLVVALVVFGFFGYLWFEYRQFAGSPNLLITSPQDQQSVSLPAVMVEGQTDPEAKVKVNDQEIPVDSNGKFSQEIKLFAPTNVITITATNKFGRSTTAQRTVYVKSGS